MKRSWATGNQFEISHGDQTAVVCELGAALRAYGDNKGPIVDGTEADEPISAGRGQVLMPWPNRIKDGKYSFEGSSQQLSITEVGKNNSSHGLLRWVNWQCVEHTNSSVTMSYESHAQSGFPFAFDAKVTYSLGEGGLHVTMQATNAGATPMPFGMGSHPYFAGDVDKSLLTCPSTKYLPTDTQGIPTGDVVDTDEFNEQTSLAGKKINGCWFGLKRDESGIANVEFNDIQVWMDSTFDYVMLYSADDVPQLERRRQSFAIEPMTCAQNAYNNGIGLLVLQPGEIVSGTWGVRRV